MVTLRFHVPISIDDSGANLDLKLPQANSTKLTFTVLEKDVAVTISPALNLVTSHQLPTAAKAVISGLPQSAVSTVECHVPLAEHTHLRWQPRAIMERNKREKEERAKRRREIAQREVLEAEVSKRKDFTNLEAKTWEEIKVKYDSSLKRAKQAFADRIDREQRKKELEDLEERERQKEKVVTSGQDILVGVCAGNIAMTVFVNYTVTSGVVNYFEMFVSDDHGSCKAQPFDEAAPAQRVGRLAIVDVTGDSLTKWESVRDEEAAGTRVRLFTSEHKQNSAPSFKLTCEMDTAGSSAYLKLPTLTPVAPNTTRLKGYIAVQGRASVEVKSLKAPYLQAIDTTELPGRLEKLRQLLMAYRFIVPQYGLQLHVMKHKDMQVLLAAAETAKYEVVYGDSGHVVYNLAFKVANTNLQFAKLTLPDPSCVMWSLIVDGESCKPAVDADGCVLVPLIKSPTETFSIHASFQMQVPALQRASTALPAANQRVEITFPRFSIGINVLVCKVVLPRGFNYGEFTGDLQEKRSSNYLAGMHIELAKESRAQGRSMLGRLNRGHNQMRTRNASFNECAEVDDMDCCSVVDECDHAMALNRGVMDQKFMDDDFDKNDLPVTTGTGAKPLLLDTQSITTGGKSFHFRKLFSTDEVLRIAVPYVEVEKAEKRSLDKGCLGGKCQCVVM
eukprot:NODE_239_length_2233_cov_62.179962_g233_i0.p1 GENE.NODE_239_length_2233_cov_62.179962_g233_i0~~NODE_239_length_2233_cov_62.179962_g233_i0.p1  ORF type:complete len:710 (-),score=193.14 NODE_239_length_2233_cov_62.179962_g233_i0:104-2125(-)